MRRKECPVGTQFGRWTTITAVYWPNGHARVLVECGCPEHTRKEVALKTLISGRSSSCSNCAHTKSVEERFFARVDMSGGPDACWPWLGARAGKGYGRLSVHGQAVPITQVAWSLSHAKPWPEGKYGCHTCDTPSCANPSHVFPGTQQENMDDMAAKGRKPFGEKKARLGERNGRAKLTDTERKQLHHDYNRGFTPSELARLYGISRSRVNVIIRKEVQSG